MEQTIILIGPMGVGKSTVGEQLAQRLDLPFVSLDDLCWEYYSEINFDHEKAKALIDSGGYSALMPYVKPFEAYAVERFVADHPNHILDFGAGHVVHQDEDLFQRVSAAFAPYPNVILLLPSPDLEESINILNERMLQRIEELGEWYSWAIDENKHFVKHPSNGRLAKVTVYTKDKTVEETCAEIVRQVSNLKQ